ncbi:MAG: amidohydrolase [Saprospiraceae bacterium]|nr:amidohydrolase [Saprospiraceae bacterium]
MLQKIFSFIILCCLISCHEDDVAVDLIIHNADIYTVDPNQPRAQGIAISKGKIIFVGKSNEVLRMKNRDTKVIDARGHFVMPGFIEGHGHFSGLGFSLVNLNFLNDRSWEAIIAKVEERAGNTPKGTWIEGRGWHQEKWDSLPVRSVQGYPMHTALSKVSPDHPVILFHASGHALFANEKAMELAGIGLDTPNPPGGRIVRNNKGEAIGVFEERAMEAVRQAYEDYRKKLSADAKEKEWQTAIALAEAECIENGITSFQDAGSSFEELTRYRRLAEKKELDIRLWAMARHDYNTMKDVIGKYKYKSPFFTCNAIKSEVDGALGAFGAWLLKPYNDKPGFTGQNTTDIYEVRKIAGLAIDNDMQFCVHAIGDRANKVVLDIYEGLASLHPEKKDLRWRVEHAQHLAVSDIPRFAKLGIIASMQGVHCTSDAPFVVKRLGTERARTGAYAWRSLLKQGVHIANGTDAPVEDVDPIRNFYATVTRKREDTRQPFYPEQRMTRAEAIKSYTIDNAYAAKEEKEKGSISPGKYADIVILSNNLLKCRESDILKTEVLFTIVNGVIVKHRN